MSGASVVAGLVFALVAVPSAWRRPVRVRLAEVHTADTPEAPGRGPVTTVLAKLGGLPGVDPKDAAFVGGLVVVLPLLALATGPVVGLAALVLGAWALRSRKRARTRRRARLIERGLPEVVDLLALVAGAGRPTPTALAEIASRLPEPFRQEINAITRRTTAGEPFADSISRLRHRLGDCVTPLVYAITAAEVDGVPLRPALERVADEAHRRRWVRATEAARRVPVLMLFPLVFCILPAFGLLTVVPLLVGSVAELQLPL